jgi:hypothetical protein
MLIVFVVSHFVCVPDTHIQLLAFTRSLMTVHSCAHLPTSHSTRRMRAQVSLPRNKLSLIVAATPCRQQRMLSTAHTDHPWVHPCMQA